MNWKRSVCLLGAVLMCTSLLVAADKPPATMQDAAKVASQQQQAPTVAENVVFDAKKASKIAAEPMQRVKVLKNQTAHTGMTPLLSREVPANDDCANAEAIGAVTDYPFDTTEATFDGVGTCMTSPNIWYCYTAGETGDVMIDLCGSTYDTKLAVYDGCVCDPLTQIECNDDASYCDGRSVQSMVEFAAIAGNQYLIEVGGYDVNAGPGDLTITELGAILGACCDASYNCIATNTIAECDVLAGEWYEGEDCTTFTCPVPVPGDTCADPYVITALPFSIVDTTCGRVDDYDYPDSTGCMYYYDSGEDMLFELTLADAVNVTITLDPNTTTWAGVGIGTACPVGDPNYCVAVAYSSSGDPKIIEDLALAAGTYYIQVDTWSTPDCLPQFTLTIEEFALPTGACCDASQNCVATNTEVECDGLGGLWYEGEDCATYVCPTPVPGDDCDTAIPVTTYPYTDSNGPGGGPDCPELLDEWYAMWYAMDLPYASNEIEITLCATGLYNSGIIIMDDCACDDYLNDSGYVFADDCITLHFRVDGPSTWYFPAIAEDELGTLLAYDVTINVTEVEDCVIDCTDNEGEGDCYEGYDDTYNGGCNADPMVFQPIACGDTICGSTGVFYFTTSYFRDMDWFTITLTEPKTLTWGGMSELPLALWIVSEDCSASVASGTTVYGCEELYISATLQPGTYYPLVSVPDWDPTWACGSKYEVSLTCTDPTGACCVEGSCVATNTIAACDGLGGDWYIDEDCSTFTCPAACTEATIGITITTDDWPDETTWVVQENGTGTVVGSGGPYTSTTTYVTNVCVPYNGCWDFIIYDAYGDGIYSPGGYTVTYEGTVIADTMGGLFTDGQDDVLFFGDGCEYPPGACCDASLNCIATNTQPECDALGGRFFEGETCPEFTCPDADFIETAPFTTPVRSTCGEGDDCAIASCASNATEEVTYRVTIPHDGLWAFDLCGSSFDTLLTVGTTECSDDLGCNDDACSTQSLLTLSLTAGDYYVAVEGYSTCGDYILDVYEDIPCDYTCPSNGFIEGEEICYDGYEDAYNVGCNADPAVFQYIDCDEVICGGSGTFILGTWNYRDTDWYEFTLDGGINQVEMTVCANFPWLAFIIEGPCPGTTLQQAEGDAYDEGTVAAVLQAGTYYLWVGPSIFGSGAPCDESVYLATVSGLGDCICGDFTGPEDPAGSGEFPPDGVVDELDFYFFLDAYGTCDGDLKYQAVCDFDEDNCITALDYQAWIACYRDATGKRFVNPAFKTLRRGTSGGRVVAP